MMNQLVTIEDIQTQGRTVAAPHVVTVSAEALDGWPCDKRQPFAQQGDLYFYRLQTLPQGARQDTHAGGQLAPGSTQGARHCVDPTRVRLYRLPHPSALDGPLIEAPEGITVTHPEHGHIVLPPGLYGVTFQRSFADELRRVAD